MTASSVGSSFGAANPELENDGNPPPYDPASGDKSSFCIYHIGSSCYILRILHGAISSLSAFQIYS